MTREIPNFLHLYIYVNLVPFAYARLKTAFGSGIRLRQRELVKLNLDVRLVLLLRVVNLVGDVVLVIPVAAVVELGVDHQNVLVGLDGTMTEDIHAARYLGIGNIHSYREWDGYHV